MSTTEESYKLGKFLLASGVVIFGIGQSLLFIVVAPLARSIGLTEFQFGIAFSLANFSLLIAAPFWGRKSDVIGRKPVFIIGLVGSALGILAMAATLSYGMQGTVGITLIMVMIFGSRFLYGLTASGIYPSANGYIADVTAWADRAKGMALIGSANALGSILGPAIGGGLAFLGVLFPMYAAATIALIASVIAIIWLVEPAQHKIRQQNMDPSKPKLKFTDARLYPYMIMWATFFVTFISLNFITAFYIQDRFQITEIADVMRTASLMLACMAIIITLVQGVLFQIIKTSPQVLLMICAPLFGAGLFTMAFAPNLVVLGLGFGILGASFACATPGINGCASLKMEAHEQGAASGFLSAANTTGAILGPIFGTALYKIQPSAPLLTGGVMMIALTIYAFTIPAPEQYKKAARQNPAQG
jgi:MFS family permease